MKKTLSVLLTIAMLLSLSVCAFAEGETDTQATGAVVEAEPVTPAADGATTGGLQDAVNTAGDNGTVIVDATNEEPAADFGGVVVDGDDKNLTIQVEGDVNITAPSVGSTGTETQGLQLIMESDSVTIKGVDGEDGENAEIVFNGGAEDEDNEKLKMGIQNYTDLTLNNVTIDGTDLAGESPNYVVSNNSGSLTVTNGASIIAADGDFAFDLCIGGSGEIYLADVPQITITETAGTIDGNIELSASWRAKTDDKIDDEKVKDEAAPALDIEGGIFKNFAIIIDKAIEDFYGKILNVTGGTFSFDSNATAGDGYLVVNTPEGLSAYIPSGSEIVAGEGGAYLVRAIVKETPDSKPVEVYIPVEYYAPAAGTVGTVTAGNAEVVVDGETVSVALNDTVVSAKVAPVALADNAPAEVKVVVSHTALSGNVFTAIDMVQNIADTLIVKDVEGIHLDAEHYEVVFDGYDTITLKLAPELLAELGAGTHVFTIVLGGGYEIQVTVVVA